MILGIVKKVDVEYYITKLLDNFLFESEIVQNLLSIESRRTPANVFKIAEADWPYWQNYSPILSSANR